MGKKVTIRDVAQMAHVSVATVSYVLNQKERQKISEPTKKKVFATAEKMGYRSFALVNKLMAEKAGKILFLYQDTPNNFKKGQIQDFFERLAAGLHCYDRDLVVIPDMLNIKSSFCEAIVCYDTSAKFLAEVKANNIVPVIGVDVDMPLGALSHLCLQPEEALAQAEKVFGHRAYDVLYFPYTDLNLNRRFKEAFPNAVAIGDLSELNQYLKSESTRPIFAIGRSIYEGFKALDREVVLYEQASSSKIDEICHAIVVAIEEDLPKLEELGK